MRYKTSTLVDKSRRLVTQRQALQDTRQGILAAWHGLDEGQSKVEVMEDLAALAHAIRMYDEAP